MKQTTTLKQDSVLTRSHRGFISCEPVIVSSNFNFADAPLSLSLTSAGGLGLPSSHRSASHSSLLTTAMRRCMSRWQTEKRRTRSAELTEHGNASPLHVAGMTVNSDGVTARVTHFSPPAERVSWSQ